ncbi:hypothetical protein CMU19_07210 [Elizabethkingia anophelis]|nr:hypothetical protein [Elizabethkingia anophelis]
MEGKAKETFDTWYIKKVRQRPDIGQRYFDEHLLEFLYNSGDTIKNAHIIEWLDSVGIFIFTRRLTMLLEFREWYFIITNSDGVHLNCHVCQESRILKDSRQEATEAAIKKAVEIYNEKYKES